MNKDTGFLKNELFNLKEVESTRSITRKALISVASNLCKRKKTDNELHFKRTVNVEKIVCCYASITESFHHNNK